VKITRNVILDLLPLYLAGEVSADTRTLVREYLETDPELAQIGKQSAIELPDDIPIPPIKEKKMEAYKEAQRLILRRTIVWAVLIAFVLFSCMAFAVLVAFYGLPG